MKGYYIIDKDCEDKVYVCKICGSHFDYPTEPCPNCGGKEREVANEQD